MPVANQTFQIGDASLRSLTDAPSYGSAGQLELSLRLTAAPVVALTVTIDSHQTLLLDWAFTTAGLSPHTADAVPWEVIASISLAKANRAIAFGT